MIRGLLIAFLFIVSSYCNLYSDNESYLIHLTKNNFKNFVLDRSDFWLIEFYAQWCELCKTIAPEFENISRYLRGVIKIGVINVDQEKSLVDQYNIKGYPYILFFGPDKSNPIDFKGDLGAKSLSRWTFNQAKRIVMDRIEGNSSFDEPKGDNETKKLEEEEGIVINKIEDVKIDEKESLTDNPSKEEKIEKVVEEPKFTDKDVIVLTDSNFDELVSQGNYLWLIDFFAPWCSHCKELEPSWNSAATELKGKVKLGKVDCTQNSELVKRFSISAYPMIRMLPPVENKVEKSEKYDGTRDANGLVMYALGKLDKYGIIPDIDQLTNQEQFQDICIDRVGICFIAFFPHIYDSSAEERKNYFDMLKDAIKSSRGKPYYFLWAQGGDFYDFEQKLWLSYGYPALVAIAYSKKKFSYLKSSFENININNFITNLFIGKEQLYDIISLPKLKTVNKWDGQDNKPEYEKDISGHDDL